MSTWLQPYSLWTPSPKNKREHLLVQPLFLFMEGFTLGDVRKGISGRWKSCRGFRGSISGQIIILQQTKFSWNKKISLTENHKFEVRSGEVAIIGPDIFIYIYIHIYIYVYIYINTPPLSLASPHFRIRSQPRIINHHPSPSDVAMTPKISSRPTKRAILREMRNPGWLRTGSL